MAGYEAERELWAHARVLRREKSRHHTTAKDFRSEIRLLQHLTGDKRFGELSRLLDEHGLIDSAGQWAEKKSSFEAAHDASLVRFIEYGLSRGWSVHKACAKWAADCDDSSNSFDAAVKRAERIWRRHLAALDKSPPP